MEIQDNISKAREIANTFIDVAVGAGAFTGALEMAEWKDQQFKEYLEKKRKQVATTGQVCLIDEIINELFGETENVDHSNNDE